MLRIQSFEIDSLIPILSGLVSGDTRPESYILASTLLKIYPSSEAYQVSYLIISALEELESIRIKSPIVPTINPDVLLEIIEQNIYEQLKENRNAGFQEYAEQVCQVPLDAFNDESLAVVADSLINSAKEVLDSALALGKSVEDSMSLIFTFVRQYKTAILRELGLVAELISNNDMKQIQYSFWGWKKFLSFHKIFSSSKAETLLNLISDFMRSKDKWTHDGDAVLTDINQIIKLEHKSVESMHPIVSLPLGAFNEVWKLKRNNVSTVVASKGVGKTTFVSYLAAIFLANDLKVMFYSPETPDYVMLNENILCAYIRAKYGFLVNANQVLGLEEPYAQGSEYTPEEKKVIIQLAKEKLAESASFFHVSNYYSYKTMESDLRAHAKLLNPDLVIFDHTQELREESDANKKTSLVATAMKSLVKDFGAHGIMLSHPSNAGFKEAMPTAENPISQDKKIAAWSQDVENLSDNILGLVRNGGTEMRIFFTKLRGGVIPPMYQVLQMNKPHCWFDYRNEDQYSQTESSLAMADLMNGRYAQLVDEDEGDSDFD